VRNKSYVEEDGQYAGGVVNVITKSGTNAFHGSLFEFLRNDKMNANVWTPGGTLTKAPLRRNQYGVSAGGPIKHDKTFFFGTWSGLRQITSTLLNTAVVPTALERTGDFSQSKVAPTDPNTKKPFAGGLIPLAPYFFVADLRTGLVVSVAVTLSALFIFGCIKAKFTDIPWWRGGSQTMLIGGLAAAAAFAIAGLFR
jgi:hypothetical protein